ncbi:VOC family protein [Micromonospora sp. CA-240977]|uniref:VOC family protein n=1 Tax=Micromonospora sp. CA-240977 TaxID=3239957 RepID=UPI003D8AE0E4
MSHDVDGLHHVGHLVRNLPAAVDAYRRLGFTVSPPAYPAVPGGPDQPARALGAANAHVYLRRGFIELVSVLDEGQSVPSDATIIPITAPAAKLPALMTAIRGTVANLAARLDYFQGVHILMLDAPDLTRAAARLDNTHVAHGGVHATQRPIDTPGGTGTEPVRYLEIADDPPEGRIGLAESQPADTSHRPAHANGAVDLVDCLLCVSDADLSDAHDRYRRYLNRPAQPSGPVRRFHLDHGTVTIVAASALPDLSPDQRPSTLPAFVGYTVTVHDLSQTENHLRVAGVPHTKHRPTAIAVPAGEALGVAITFQQVTS